MDIVIDLDHRCQGAAPQTSHPLEIETSVLSCLPRRDIQLPLDPFAENLPSPDVASSSHTDLNGVSARGAEPKLGIKRGHSKDLIFRNSQEPGNMCNRPFRDIPGLFLDPLEEWDQISLLAFESRKNANVIFVRQRTTSVLGSEQPVFSILGLARVQGICNR